MCQFKSAILTQNDIFHIPDIDSHETIVRKYNLDDTTLYPNFVRLEMVPINGLDKVDVNNLIRSEWKLIVDQDIRPDWFSEKEAAELMWPLVGQCIKGRPARIANVIKHYWSLGARGEGSVEKMKYMRSLDNSILVSVGLASAEIRDEVTRFADEERK